MVDEAASIMTGNGSLDTFGELLHESWMLKRGLSPAVTSDSVDEVYDTARRHGALGGKLMGAGGTGFMMFYVPPERQASVREALPAYLHVPFKFESEGTDLVYYSPIDSRAPAGIVG